MFTIYSDNTLIYDDTSTDPSLKLISPKLSLVQSSAGSLTFTVPPGNVGYNSLDRLTSFIRVFKNTQSGPYWEGRILSETIDFWNCKQITCEGILGVLNDTIQPPNHYQNQTARSFLTALLDIHNSKVEAWKRIYVGVTDAQMTSSHRYTNYESTLECINDKLLNKEGGYIQIRNENGTRYLDYLTNYPQENTQKIEFGKNLLDFSKSFSSEDFCTVLVPRGAELGEGPYEALVPYVDVSSVNNGSIYVTLTNEDFDTPPDVLPVDEFGWIEAVHDWEDVYLPQNLLTKAKQYLKDQQFDNMQLSVNAVDMRYAGVQYEQIDLNDSVRVVSAPHGLDRLFPVTKLDIPLDAPESTQFTLGTTVQVSLTHRDKKNISAVKNEIAQLPTKQNIVAEAKSQAADLIEKAVEGYVTIIHNEETGSEELIISTTPNYLDPQAKIWRWNANGLAYSPNGYNSGVYTVAITSDGAINADLVSTGTLNANLIQGGILQDQHGGGTFYLNLDNGELRIGSLSDTITKLNNLGGRNYCWAISKSIHEEVTYSQCDCSYNQNDSGKYVVTSRGGSGFCQALYPAGIIRVPQNLIGQKMTLSAKSITPSGNNDSRVFLIIANSSGAQIGTAPYISSGSTSVTFTVPEGAVSFRPVIRVRQTGTNVAGESVTVVGLKVEKGEVVTDWDPAPEDVEALIVNGDYDVVDGFSSTFEKIDSSISTVVEDIKTINGDASTEGSIRKIVSTAVTQTAEDFDLAITNVDGKYNGLKNNVEAHFTFSQSGLRITGTENSTSGSFLDLSAGEVALWESNAKRLWLNSSGANADAFNANNYIKIGDSSTGKFVWEAYSGGFRLRKVQ